MSNKIRAAIRVRPLLQTQLRNGCKNSRFSIDKHHKEIYISKRSFHFDYLFGEDSTQEEVYGACKIDHLVDKAVEGYHSTIFAYGQTGSGKTYTMQGDEDFEEGLKSQLNGMIPKVIKQVFKIIEQKNNQRQRTFSVAVSYLQIYNQKIYDLLNPSSLNPRNINNPSNVNGLRMRWSKDEDFLVENLFVFDCSNSQQLMKYFKYGLKNRIISSHKLNMSSSRSHSILTIRLSSYHHSDPSRVLHSKIELVDLAGSERIGMTGTQGKLAKQSIDINKSLFTLRQVISILAETAKNKAKTYVPYRDSKLTSILKQSIGGNSYSLMIACINPNDQFIQENLSTLTYATKASFITNKPTINDDPRSKIITDLRKQIKQLNSELGKANQHIEFISNIGPGTEQQGLGSGQQGLGSGQQERAEQRIPGQFVSQRKPTRIIEEEEVDLTMPSPVFHKGRSENFGGQYDQFSERLVESINMVRELLKSNKELREQLEDANARVESRDVEIEELSRENEFLKEKTGSVRAHNDRASRPGSEEGKRPTSFRNKNITAAKIGLNNPLQNGFNATTSNANRSNINYWNSVQINQYYMNEKGIDSIPTNFNNRDINSAHNARVSRSMIGPSERNERHAITAKSTKRSWMSKNSEPKKFLSFYNDPSRQPTGFY